MFISVLSGLPFYFSCNFIKKTLAKAAKTKPAKYSDKSAGQPELVPVFHAIKKIISSYARGNYRAKADKPGHYELYYDKEVEHQGRTYPELYFASVLIQKGYVGFYFFPAYANDSLKQKLKPGLLKTLKGKTCFHIKNGDPVMLQEIKEALQTGYDYYVFRGWK
jgi:hypothetical protein